MKILIEYYKNTTKYDYIDELSFVPRVGETVFNEDLKELGSTGLFMVSDIFYNQSEKNIIVEVKEITPTTDIESFRRELLKENGYI